MRMDPVYKFLPYPYQRDQMHCWPNHYGGTEAVPMQMCSNTIQPPLNDWSSGSNCRYAYPLSCHGSCNHGYMPNPYAWGHPCAYAPPAYFPGSYSPFPAHYMPHPHCIENPRHEYEQNMVRDHYFCGCPNHLCSKKEHTYVRTEEGELDREREKSAPLKFKNSPCPLTWLPFDCSKEQGKCRESECKDVEENSLYNKPRESQKDVEQHSGVWNGCHPCELDNLGLPEKKVEKRPSSHEPGNANGRFPFPIHWMPYIPEDKERERSKEKNVDPIPFSVSDKLSGEKTGGKASSKVRDIPVMEAGQNKKSEERIDIPLKDGVNNGEKFMKDDSKRKASSPPKSSKLPPICLRVEPLPSRKTARKSRSPSPPGDKRKEDDSPIEVKGVLLSSAKEKPASQQDLSINTVEENHKAENIPKNLTETQSVMADEIKKFNKRELSEEEAAVVIQSAYRGFDIRRWEPVKKLKQIAEVREEVVRVKYLIQEMDLHSDIKGNGKERHVISETIMSLLLKLDAIQGLHSSIREVRKSVAKELVNLEEKLDSLAKEQAESSPGHGSVIHCDEDVSKEVVDDPLYQDRNETQPGLVEQYDLLGASHYDSTEGSEPVLIEEQPSGELDEEAAEFPELVVENEDRQINDFLRNDEVTIDRNMDDCEDLILEQSCDCLPSQRNSLMEITSLPNDETKRKSYYAEISQEVPGCSYVQEGTEHALIDADTSKTGQTEHLEEANLGLESKEAALTCHSCENFKSDDDKFGTLIEVDGKIEESSIKSDICCHVFPPNDSTAIFESPTSDEREPQLAEFCNSPILEEEVGKLPEKEIKSETESSESVNIDEDAARIGNAPADEKVVSDQGKQDAGKVINEEEPQYKEPSQGDQIGPGDYFQEVCSGKIDIEDLFLGDQNLENGIAAMEENNASTCCVNPDPNPALVVGDDRVEANGKLTEENEKLRDMVEKLIKSGQEQLNMISCLSGRVQDLERNLSRRKKLKMKQCRGKRSYSLKEWAAGVAV